MPYKPDKFIDYCIGIAQEFQGRLNRFRAFVKHNVSSGTANEVILREFLAAHAPGDFAVAQGFICEPTEENKVSKQCDILVYDQNYYPLVYSDGPIKVVWPEAARMVIEVKTNFDKDDIDTSLHNIESARSLNRQIAGIIFAFTSPTIENVIDNLAKYNYRISEVCSPTAIVLLDKGVIIHRWYWARNLDLLNNQQLDPSAYAVVQGKGENNGAIAIAFLLLHFFEVVGAGRGLYGTDAINMSMELFRNHTSHHSEIYIGQR